MDTPARLLRIVNATLGFWLFVSAFAWPHTRAQAANAVLSGLLISLTALSGWAAGAQTRLGYANAALGAWVVLSIVAFPNLSIATALNSSIVGSLVFVNALVPMTYRAHARSSEP